MSKVTRRRSLPVLTAVAAAGLLAACSSGGSSASSGAAASPGSAPVTIKAMLPPNTGAISAADNAGLKTLTTQYEAAHKNVTVTWLPNNSSSITQSNATV